jgi:hypothetical protein
VKKWVLSMLVAAMLLPLSGCDKQPPDLTPEAKIAFQATRVVKVLDVVRDAAIAANDLVPPVISTNDTRTVVLWHKVAVQTIAATPGGWKPTVKASIYALSCHPQAYVPGPGIPLPDACVPQIPAEANMRLRPYIGLALVVIAEVL